MTNIFTISTENLAAELSKEDLKPFRAKQISEWIYKKHIIDPLLWHNIPQNLKNSIKEKYSFLSLELLKKIKSKDGSVKYIFQTYDEHQVETVYIPQKDRQTVCLSVQVGCPGGCSFCNTANMGFVRNLTADEIISQYLLVEQFEQTTLTNIVYMGMGDPLFNFEATLLSLERFISNSYFGLSRRKVVVSSCGVPEKIVKLAECEFAPKFALSLHFVDDANRKKYMNSAGAYSIDDLVEACYMYNQITNLPITYEYILIDSLNSSLEDAKILSEIAMRIRGTRINIIPFNSFEGSKFSAPSSEAVDKFQSYLTQNGILTFKRVSAGSEIYGACGTLGG